MRPVTERATPNGRQRRVFLGARVRRALGAAIAVACLAGSAGAAYVGMQSNIFGAVARTGMAALLETTATLGLRVDEVIVSGRHTTPSATVLAALDVKRGDPILAFSPAGARAALEASPWIRSATVERSLPGTVRVRIEERVALALWQERGRFRVIDMDGVVIPVGDVRPFHHLPILVGDDAPQHAATLLAMLASEPELALRVTAAIRVSGRRWNIRFEDRVELRLPAADPAGAWHRFARLERAQGLLSRNLTVIDFRLPDRLVIEPSGTGIKKPKTPGKPT
ncbi:MAG: FtsQ-type POTRA domain-containing protein [Alphaproteobacteria bacterium]|nr:FtsQ-type POTRA domain-containing protein [Alphaproteobacteria bacterium]